VARTAACRSVAEARLDRHPHRQLVFQVSKARDSQDHVVGLDVAVPRADPRLHLGGILCGDVLRSAGSLRTLNSSQSPLPYGLNCRRFNSPCRTARLPRLPREYLVVRNESPSRPAWAATTCRSAAAIHAPGCLGIRGSGDRRAASGIRSATWSTPWLRLPCGRLTTGPLTMSAVADAASASQPLYCERRHRHLAHIGP